MYICTYIYTYIYIYIHVWRYIHIYIYTTYLLANYALLDVTLNAKRILTPGNSWNHSVIIYVNKYIHKYIPRNCWQRTRYLTSSPLQPLSIILNRYIYICIIHSCWKQTRYSTYTILFIITYVNKYMYTYILHSCCSRMRYSTSRSPRRSAHYNISMLCQNYKADLRSRQRVFGLACSVLTQGYSRHVSTRFEYEFTELVSHVFRHKERKEERMT